MNDWDATVVRAAMTANTSGLGYVNNPDAEKRKVKAIVDAAIARGIYVLIDWHDHDAVQPRNKEAAKRLFREMATEYGDEPAVIFEVFNEPDTETWAQVKAYAEEVIREIRGAGSDNLRDRRVAELVAGRGRRLQEPDHELQQHRLHAPLLCLDAQGRAAHQGEDRAFRGPRAVRHRVGHLLLHRRRRAGSRRGAAVARLHGQQQHQLAQLVDRRQGRVLRRASGPARAPAARGRMAS